MYNIYLHTEGSDRQTHGPSPKFHTNAIVCFQHKIKCLDDCKTVGILLDIFKLHHKSRQSRVDVDIVNEMDGIENIDSKLSSY